MRMLSPKLENPTPGTEHLAEKNYRPVILRMSKESGMLNSMTESSFSRLFSRSSSSCNRKDSAQRARGTATGSREGGDARAAPKQDLTYHFGLLHRAWEAIQEEAILTGRGVEVVLNQLHHHLIAHLQRGETGQEGQPDFTHSCCTCASAQAAPDPFYSRPWSQRQQQPQRRALLLARQKLHVQTCPRQGGTPCHGRQREDVANETFHTRDTPACAETRTSTVTALLQRLLYFKGDHQLEDKLSRLLFFLNQFTIQNIDITFISCYFVPSSPSVGRPGQEGQSR